MPQPFYITINGSLELLVIKMVDDLLMKGSDAKIQEFLVKFNSKFELGTVVHGAGVLKFKD